LHFDPQYHDELPQFRIYPDTVFARVTDQLACGVLEMGSKSLQNAAPAPRGKFGKAGGS